MEDYMKIVKKIFALSTSAILGLSFCAGTVFAGGVSKNSSKISVKPAVNKAYPYHKLRRTSEMNSYYGMVSLDAIRKSAKSVPLKYEDEILKNLEEEEAESADIVSIILGLNFSERLIV